jgi:hypothetical protein
MPILEPMSFIQIDGILDKGLVYEIGRYGPCGKIMVRVDHLINMLNRGVRVSIPEKWLEDVYLLVKQYNLTVEKTNSKNYKVASQAEYTLEKTLLSDVIYKELIDKKNNPLEDYLGEGDYREDLTSRPINRKKKPYSKTRMAELFKKRVIEGEIPHIFEKVDFIID